MNDMAPRGMGDNSPPEDLKLDIETRYHDSLNQVAELLDAASTVPDVIEDDATQTKVAELIRKIRFVETTLDGARKLEKEPHDAKVKLINGVFNTRIEKLEAKRKVINERSTAYLEKKAATEKRRLAEEEEIRRAAAAKALAEAQEAERIKREAEEAQRKAEAEALAAQHARDKAIAEQKAAEERAELARLEEVRLAAERKKREIEDGILAKQKAERDAVEQAQRDEQKRLDEIAMAAAKANREAEEALARTAKDEAAKALAERRDAEEATRLAKADVKVAGRDEKAAMGSALREERRADKIAGVIDGPEADLARTRSEHGAVSTLQRVWKSRIVDRTKLPIATLFPFIDSEALEIAVRKYMLTQAPENRVMAGTVMEQETTGQVR